PNRANHARNRDRRQDADVDGVDLPRQPDDILADIVAEFGTGPATITLTANGAGFEPSAYRATITIQSPNAVPQVLNVPVMFVLGGNGSVTIGGGWELGD